MGEMRRAPIPSYARRRRGPVVALVVVLAVVAAMAVVWWRAESRARAERAAAERLVRDFAAAWENGDLTGIPSSAGELQDRFATVTEEMGGADVAVTPGPVEVGDVGATSTAEVVWTLPGGHEWRYSTVIPLQRLSGDEPLWQVDWSPAVLHPELRVGERLELTRRRPRRGNIVDADGDPIVRPRPVVHVAVQPSRVEDLDDLTDTLEDLLDIDGEDLAERVEQAPPDGAVPVITLREGDYRELRSELRPLPGTVFREDELPLAPNRAFARALLGTVGEVTAEQLEEHPGRYERGDIVGRSGLQRAFDDRLRGRAGVEVAAVPVPEDDDGGDGDGGDDDDAGRTLFEVDAEDGRDIAITLRRRVQRAADRVLSDVDHPSALVAIDVPTGHVVAVANNEEAGFDIATTGQYPPGSIFKVVTATRLLEDGLEPDDTVQCPSTATVDGRPFRNAEDSQLGAVPFATAFAQSCNTAFVELSRRLEPGALQETAEQRFGIGNRGDLGIGAYTGQVPREDSAVEIAAAGIGQGEVLVSPLIAADMAATVARGGWLEPRLVLEPAGDEQRSAELPPAEVLQELTRDVVTDGSGTALRGVPGHAVHGKTGTAEYGDEDPPRTHAWFIGYQDDLAFAVLVAETRDSFGGEVAAPIAAEFLTELRSD